MLLITWNVNSLRARLPRLQELLEKHQPDVAMLQETKCSEANFPAAEIEAAGYSVVQHSGGQWAGVAILVKSPLQASDPQLGLPGEPVPEEARWVEASAGGIRFISTYVHNGRAVDHPEFTNKLDFLEAAALRAGAERERADALPLVIAGDFNVAPTDEDAWNAALFETHVTAPEREAVAALKARGDLVDAYRQVHPDTPQFTWWDYRAGAFHKNLGLRIDLILISQTLVERILACAIDRDMRKGSKPSDHAPLLLWLGLESPPAAAD